MIKQLSHTQFSFKPRQKGINESFSSNRQIQYDSLISTILSHATLTNELSSLNKISDNNLATFTELT